MFNSVTTSKSHNRDNSFPLYSNVIYSLSIFKSLYLLIYLISLYVKYRWPVTYCFFFYLVKTRIYICCNVCCTDIVCRGFQAVVVDLSYPDHDYALHLGFKTRLLTQTRKMASYHCCVPNCTNDSRYDKSLSFHSIPNDPNRKKMWLIKIRRDEGPLFKVIITISSCYRK